jgi:hypothetical protein
MGERGGKGGKDGGKGGGKGGKMGERGGDGNFGKVHWGEGETGNTKSISLFTHT